MPDVIINVPMKRGGTMPMRVAYYTERLIPGDYGVTYACADIVPEWVGFMRDTPFKSRDRSALVDEDGMRDALEKALKGD